MSLKQASLLALLVGAPGCLDQLQNSDELVTIYATHHATPVNGAFPDRGGDMQPRRFEAGGGWMLTLAESYITIASTTLVGCGGVEHELTMFWGPCPEDLRRADLGTLTVSGLKVPPGDYCELRVEYAPYRTPVVEGASTRHVVPSLPAVEGDTIFLRGVARRGDDEVQFQLENDEQFEVSLDLSEINGPGSPLRIRRGQDFPTDVTVSKTYDRFFDGVQWDEFDAEARDRLEESLDEVLRDQTRAASGQTVPPELFAQ